jgi:chaperone required for assembly of F1-ATPase
MKRFWREVAIGPDRVVALDGRPVRTPGRAPLALPTDALAAAVADEWRGVGETVDPRAMPLTGLANAAIDRLAPDPAPFAADLARYAESDLLCYRAETPRPLVARQAERWDPPLGWAETRYDIHVVRVAGIVHRPQPPATIARLAAAVAAQDPFRLAALASLVPLTGSLVLGLALAEAAIDPDAAWAAANVDEDWQIEQWGEDALAAAARADRRRAFDAGVRFLAALD